MCGTTEVVYGMTAAVNRTTEAKGTGIESVFRERFLESNSWGGEKMFFLFYKYKVKYEMY